MTNWFWNPPVKEKNEVMALVKKEMKKSSN